MNLADLTSYICTKGQMTGTADRAAAKLFLSKRYELIYNSYLWKDSLVMVDVTVDPADADNAEGIVLLPEVIDRVVAIRTADRSVRVRGLEDYYRIDADQFARTGSAFEFSLLSPVWFIWRGYHGLVIQAAEAGDNSVEMLVTWRDETGARFVQKLKHGDKLSYPIPADALTTTVTGCGQSDVNGTYVTPGKINGKPYFTKGGVTLIQWDGSKWKLYSLTMLAYAYESAAAVATPDLVTNWTAINGAPNPLPLFSAFAGAVRRFEVESVFKPTTTNIMILNAQFNGDSAGGIIGATDLKSPSYQRVRLFSIPSVATTLKVLGKKKFEPLTFDQEEPAIKNLDNCLLALALGDLWARRRQMGKAAMFYQEGAALLKELALLETVQAAHNTQFLPDGGAGDALFGPGRSGGIGF